LFYWHIAETIEEGITTLKREFYSSRLSYTKIPFRVEKHTFINSIYEKSRNIPKRKGSLPVRERHTKLLNHYYKLHNKVEVHSSLLSK
jgi:hypothetical protein